MATESMQLGGMPTHEGDLSIEGHGIEPIPQIGPLRLGQSRVHGLVHAEPRPGGLLHRALAAADFLQVGFVTWIAGDHRRQPASARSSSAC